MTTSVEGNSSVDFDLLSLLSKSESTGMFSLRAYSLVKRSISLVPPMNSSNCSFSRALTYFVGMPVIRETSWRVIPNSSRLFLSTTPSMTDLDRNYELMQTRTQPTLVRHGLHDIANTPTFFTVDKLYRGANHQLNAIKSSK